MKKSNQHQTTSLHTKETTFQMVGEPINAIPKYATHVTLNKLDNGNVILLFSAKQPEADKMVLIETIMVDSNLAKKMLDSLDTILTTQE